MSVIRIRRSALERRADDVVVRHVLSEEGLPPVRGEPSVVAILPNGRVVWLRLHPRPASSSEVDDLGRAAERADLQHDADLRANTRALQRLAARLTEDDERVVQARLARERKLVRRMVAGDGRLDSRFTSETAVQQLEDRRQSVHELAFLRRQRRRQLWDGLVIASALPLFAAYGQRSKPFAEHNLVLMLTLGVWVLGDELSDLLSSISRTGPMARDVDVWSYIAPLGNMLSGWWLLSGRQHQRFVTGAVDSFTVNATKTDADPPEVRYVFEAQLDLAPWLAVEHIDDFRGFPGVPAVATLASPEWPAELAKLELRVVGVAARVQLGVLILMVTVVGPVKPTPTEPLPQPTIMWIVDTQDPEE